MKRPAMLCCCMCSALLFASCRDTVTAPLDLPPRFSATEPFNNSGACLGQDMITWSELVAGVNPADDPLAVSLCTANDVVLSGLAVTEVLVGSTWVPVAPGDPIACTIGESVTFKANASLQSFAASFRHDVGLWLATDGGNARVGSCNNYNIPVSPLPDGASNPDLDQCGELDPASQVALALGAITVPCNPGPDGNLSIGSCTTWTSPASTRECPVATIPGPNGFRAGTLPGNTASCNCGSVAVVTNPNVAQNAQLEVRKACSPSSDPGTFDLLIDNAVVAAGAACGGSTGAQIVSAGNTANPGAFHTFAESGFDIGAYESGYQCLHRASGALVTQCGVTGDDACSGSGTGPVSIRTDPGQDLLCTFTNTRLSATGPGSVMLQNGSFSLVANQTGAALSGSVPVRNSSMGSQSVTVTGLEITDAWVKQGNTLLPRTVTGCSFSPVPFTIDAGSTQTFTMTGCDVAPPVDSKKDLNFVVRVYTSNTVQPFYERSYKVKAQ